MDIGEMKKMLKNSTAVLIMDNGEPSFVVVNYESYRDLLANPAAGGEREIKINATNGTALSKVSASGEVELLERINKDILALKAQIEEEEKQLVI